ncbi:MAG: bifunctional hydroxymethylpyrimidine kinase/phosphomethylpyrimidine kinase [Lentisphaerae bacterium]|nr:bifunctional hydroxymethylpyrimidine kinase/phosphomethylpyrimidine kinase [Lentisphaerota bacterium]
MPLVIVGSIGLDDIATPHARRESLLGGSVSYACAAASFFTRVGMVGIIGSDFPAKYLDLYRRLGIDLEGLQRVQGKTFRWAGEYDTDLINRHTLRTELNVFETFMPELPDRYRDTPFLLLGNISPELQLHVLAECRRPRFVVADTMDLWIKIARDALMRVIGRVDMLTLNDSEARLLTGIHNIRQAASCILGWGPQYVVIKKGEHGAMLVSRRGISLIPAYPLGAVQDPTGAGDTFAGAFLGVLAKGGVVHAGAVRAALLYGSVVASFGVEAFSLDRLAHLKRSEIARRLAELKKMIA